MKYELSEEDRLELASPAQRADALRRLATESIVLADVQTYVDDADPWVRAAALDYITMRPECVQVNVAKVREALTDEDEIVRVAAIECMVAMRDGGAIDAIAQLVADDDELVRCYAAWALGILGSTQHSVVLRHQATIEPEERALTAIAESLYRLTREEAWLGFLIARLDSHCPEARAFATNSLAGVVTPSNIRRIRTAMTDALAKETNEVVRRNLKRDLALLGLS